MCRPLVGPQALGFLPLFWWPVQVGWRWELALPREIQRDFRWLVNCPKQIQKRSEEHTSELHSPYDLVCRLLLEKKKTQYNLSFNALLQYLFDRSPVITQLGNLA